MHGRGGQGIVVGGEILANVFLKEGKYLAVMPSYGVERRGSDVTAYGRLSDEPIRENGLSYEPDYLIIFDPSQIKKQKTYDGFRKGGVIIACGTDPEAILAMGVFPSKIVLVDGIRIAYEITKNNLTNMIMCGAFARAGIVSLENTKAAMEEHLPKAFVKTSILGAERGYNEATVYEYDVAEEEEKRVPMWTKSPLACKTPDKPDYEAPWGDYTEKVVTVPTGTWRVVRPVVSEDNCVKCGICEMYCPIQCIEKAEDGYYRADMDYCKGCGVCAHECPKKAISMVLESNFT